MTALLSLDDNLVFCNISGSSKKKVLENIADNLHKAIPQLENTELFEQLIARERLGSTAIGKGVAIPHCRSDKVEQTIAGLVKLNEAVDFEAPDDLPVDLLFVMVVPEQATNEHLQTLAYLAQLFEQSEFRNALRKAKNKHELLTVMQQFNTIAK